MTLDRSYTYELAPNAGETHYLTVNREELIQGDNIGYLYISSGTYTKTIVVKAVGLGMPVVTNPVLSNITSTTCDAQSTVTSNGGWTIVDKGFEYYYNGYNSHYTEVSCGPGEANFQMQIPVGNGISEQKVRAYASNGVYKAYSGWVYIQ